MKTKNRKVGVAVGEAVGVLVGRAVAVAVGGALTAVCVEAAENVSTMAVNGAFGSSVGTGGAVDPNVGKHGRVTISKASSERIL